MAVIPEETLLELLRRCLDLSGRALEQVAGSSISRPAAPALQKDFEDLVRDLHGHKSDDATLADECWEWIWQVKPDLSPVQVYGRLAWINYTLLDLL